MSREVIYGLTVVLLLAAILTALNVKPVEALWTGGTIYIRADGSIDPSDAPITTSDNITYRLTDDIQITSGDGIVIERDNIILNGSGHSITGSGGGRGVFLSGRVNVTVINMDIREFLYGIYLYSFSDGAILATHHAIENCIIHNNEEGILIVASENKIENCIIYNNTEAGIWISSGSKNSIMNCTFKNNICKAGIYAYVFANNTIIKDCTFLNNPMGIWLEGSINNTIERCVISGSSFGIHLKFSSGNLIKNCIMHDNSWNGINVKFGSLNNIVKDCIFYGNTDTAIDISESSNNNIVENCTIHDVTHDGIYLFACENNLIKNCTIYGCPLFGILIGELGLPEAKTCNNMVVNCTISNCFRGVNFWAGPSDNIIKGCKIFDNAHQGINVEGANSNIIESCILYNNNKSAVRICYGSNNNRVVGCLIYNNPEGILLENSVSNLIAECTIRNNGAGISSYNSSNNLIVNSAFYNNQAGLRFYSNSTGNSVYHNDFINILYNIYLDYSSNNTISENSIADSYRGIFLYNSNNNTILGNSIENSTEDGIFLSSSNDNTISGNSITNSSWSGIDLKSSNNNTISWNNIANSTEAGINLCSSSNNTLLGNSIANSTWSGIYLLYSSDNTILDNSIVNSTRSGIHLYSSSNGNTISGNSIANITYEGIRLDYSSNNTISENIIENSGCGIILCPSSNNTVCGNVFVNCGMFVLESYGNNVYGNTVNGKPLAYLEGVSDHTVEDAGQVILVQCNNITIQSLNISNTTVGVELWKTNNTKIAGNTITDNYYGIFLFYSSNNTISENSIANITWDGVYLYSSSNNTISENSIANSQCGIFLDFSSSNNTISGNSIADSTWSSIFLYSSSSNTLLDNSIADSTDGIHLYNSSKNTLSENTMENNYYGIYLYSSNDNSIYHNNFIDNTVHVCLEESYTNVWDDGYPSGGNYWSGYTDVDEKSGPNQDQPGSDGIWDHPYKIDEYNIDRYPFVNPTHNKPPSVTVLSPNGGEKWTVGSRQTIKWTAEDDSDRPEDLTINLYYSTDGGATWEPIELEVENTGEYEWTVPETPSNSCRVKVEAIDSGGLVGSDVSDADFTICKVEYGAEITYVEAVPNPVGQGSKMIFNITVTNYGEKDIPSATVYTKIYNPNKKLVKTLSTTVKAFKHDTERNVQMTYTLPSKAALGDWSYQVQVYMGKTLLDEAEDSFEVEPARIEGAILSVSDDGPVLPGKTINFTVIVENTGNIIWKSGNAKIVVKIYDPTGKLVKTLTKTLKETVPDLEYTYSLSWKLPTKAKKGTYTYDVYLYHGKLLLNEAEDNFEVE